MLYFAENTEQGMACWEILDPSKIPYHVAIIMDGNRRWAKKNHRPVEMGYMKGADTIMTIARTAAKLGVKVITVYAFSTENWNRSRAEIDSLMKVFQFYLDKMSLTMVQEGVRLETIGDLSPFPEDIKATLDKIKEMTKEGRNADLVLALNYGGRDDVRRAALKVGEDMAIGKVCKESFTEKMFSLYLDTAKWPDPDLLIRTSGELRVSNFLLWQISYSEVYISDVLWPDFTDSDLLQAIREFQKRTRRRGG
jgi:undecaprenyl diphosphate synthase